MSGSHLRIVHDKSVMLSTLLSFSQFIKFRINMKLRTSNLVSCFTSMRVEVHKIEDLGLHVLFKVRAVKLCTFILVNILANTEARDTKLPIFLHYQSGLWCIERCMNFSSSQWGKLCTSDFYWYSISWQLLKLGSSNL